MENDIRPRDEATHAEDIALPVILKAADYPYGVRMLESNVQAMINGHRLRKESEGYLHEDVRLGDRLAISSNPEVGEQERVTRSSEIFRIIRRVDASPGIFIQTVREGNLHQILPREKAPGIRKRVTEFDRTLRKIRLALCGVVAGASAVLPFAEFGIEIRESQAITESLKDYINGLNELANDSMLYGADLFVMSDEARRSRSADLDRKEMELAAQAAMIDRHIADFNKRSWIIDYPVKERPPGSGKTGIIE